MCVCVRVCVWDNWVSDAFLRLKSARYHSSLKTPKSLISKELPQNMASDQGLHYLHDSNKNLTDTLLMEMDRSWVVVEESTLYIYINGLSLLLLNMTYPVLANSVDPNQLASVCH